MSSEPFKVFLRYPFTWIVGILIVATHAGFAWWFQPSWLMHGMALAIDVGMALVWLVLAMRSEALATLSQRMPYTALSRQVQQALQDCPPAFATPATTCLALAHNIRHEFADTIYRHELDALLANLASLAENHRQLALRAQQFGTPQQRQTMRALLARQTASVEQTLQTLQTLSGHLTLLSANIGHDENSLQTLQFLNQGLQEVIQELHDA